MRPIKFVCKYIQNGKDDDGDDEIRGPDRYLHIRVQMIMMTVMMMMVMTVMMMMMLVMMNGGDSDNGSRGSGQHS